MKTLLAKLMGIGASVWQFYAPILRDLFISGASSLLPIALEIVRSLADTRKSNDMKRDTAVFLLRERATAMGLQATESLIRFTIESAVQRMKTNG